MNDERMKKQVKDVFEQDVPDVLQQIKASPQFFVPEKPTTFSFNFTPKRIAMSLSAVFVVALILIVGLNRFSDPVAASTVTLEINPSIEILLDDDDHVIGIRALNDEGEEIIQRDILYKGLTIEQLVPILVNRLNERGYIVNTVEDSNIILIEVDADTETIRTRVEVAFQVQLETEMQRFNAPYWVLNARQILLDQNARDAVSNDANLGPYSRARLTLIYRIISLDDNYTVEQLLPLTVRQLYGLYIQLEDPDNLPDYDRMPNRFPGAGMNPYIPFIFESTTL